MARTKLTPEIQGEVSQAEKVYFTALREVLPQLRNQSDEYLKQRIEKSVGKDNLSNAVLDLEGYIAAGIEGVVMQNEKFALATKLLQFLASYIQNMYPPKPVTINTMVDFMPLLGAATDQHFPGYASSKLLRYAVTPFAQLQQRGA